MFDLPVQLRRTSKKQGVQAEMGSNLQLAYIIITET